MTINPNPDRLLPLRIVAGELRLPTRVVKAMILAGNGPEAIRVGAWVRVRRDALDRYKADHPAAPATEPAA
jgi:hypothetical protein